VGPEKNTAHTTIWLASGNEHKKQELAHILTGITLKVPADGGITGFDPLETGASFPENSLLKARALYRLLAGRGIAGPVLADDSGLCVDALDGRPGLYSARYTGRYTGRYSGGYTGRYSVRPTGEAPPGGKKLDSVEQNRLLLEELGDNPRREARFVCAMVLLFDENRFVCVQETLEGEILWGPGRGDGGFGYDPIFYLPALGRTLAELGEDEKNSLSHRARAGKGMAKFLA
jgi:XTP/dITP diphosphohydrolase